MRLPFLVFSLAFFATPTLADEASDMAGLSKRAFLSEYETLVLESFALQRELFQRFDPDLAAGAIKDGPLTDEERTAMECTYDAMAELDLLDGLARQMLIARKMRDRAEANPKMDIVDLFMDEEQMMEDAGDVPDEALGVMSTCGTIAATQKRMNMSPEIWQAMGAAAAERGYLE